MGAAIYNEIKQHNPYLLSEQSVYETRELITGKLWFSRLKDTRPEYMKEPRRLFKGKSYKFSYFRILLNIILLPFLLLAEAAEWYVAFIEWFQGVIPK